MLLRMELESLSCIAINCGTITLDNSFALRREKKKKRREKKEREWEREGGRIDALRLAQHRITLLRTAILESLALLHQQCRRSRVIFRLSLHSALVQHFIIKSHRIRRKTLEVWAQSFPEEHRLQRIRTFRTSDFSSAARHKLGVANARAESATITLPSDPDVIQTERTSSNGSHPDDVSTISSTSSPVTIPSKALLGSGKQLPAGVMTLQWHTTPPDETRVSWGR